MDIDYENYYFKKPYDRMRLEEDRMKRAIEIGKARKARDKSYLKGQRGKRKYIDYDKTGITIYNDKDKYIYDDDEDDWDTLSNVFLQEICVEKSYINILNISKVEGFWLETLLGSLL